MEGRVRKESAINFLPDSSMDSEEVRSSVTTTSNSYREVEYEQFHEKYYAHIIEYELRQARFNPPHDNAQWDLEKPYNRIRDLTALVIGELEQDGVLTDRMIEVNSGCLDRSTEPGKIVLCTCDLSRKNLSDLEIIRFHPYLQHLNLSRNKLMTLEPLTYLPFLKYLDASHNLLGTLLDFKAPTYLSYVNMSYNLIDEIGDLSNFWSIVHLDLSYNMIRTIEGISELRYLDYLNLSKNDIRTVENINFSNVQILNLDHNYISDFDFGEESGLCTLYNLRHVSLANNELHQLTLFADARQIETINVSGNQIKDLVELSVLDNMNNLYDFDARNNPICENKRYRETCLSGILNLRLLDGEEVDIEEKGELHYLNSDNPLKNSNRRMCSLDVLHYLNPPEINSSVIPCYEKFVSIIILVGPLGCKKKRFISHVNTLYHRFIKVGVSYTTRPQCNQEADGVDYHFVTHARYRELLREGKLICSSQKYGHHFGIAYDELRKISEEVGVLIFHCDLTSAIQIRSRFLNSKLILTQPRDEKTHMLWLAKKFSVSKWISSYVTAFKLKYKSYKRTNINVAEDSNQVMQFMRSHIDQDEGVLLFDEIIPDQSYSKFSLLRTTGSSKEHGQTRSVSFIPDSYPMRSSLRSDSTIDYAPMKLDRGPSTLSQAIKEIRPSKITFELPTVHAIRYSDDLEVRRSVKKRTAHEQQWVEVLNSPKTNAQLMDSGSISVSEALLPTVQDSGDSFILSQMSATNFVAKSEPSSTNYEPVEVPTNLEDVQNENEAYDETVEESRSTTGASGMNQYKCISEVGMPSENFLFISGDSLQDFEEIQKAMDAFMYEQILKRKQYEDTNRLHPGLFFTHIYTDEEVDCQMEFVGLLKTCVHMQRRYTKQDQCYEYSALCPKMKHDKIEMIHELLK